VISERTALRKAYDQVADTYGTKRNPRYDAFRDSVLAWFADEVRPVATDVADLGSGPGHECVFLADAGLRPLAVDFSAAMTAQCRGRGVRSAVMDLYTLGLTEGHFGGVLMSFSLLHIPKSDATSIVGGAARALRPGGTLLVLLFEGAGEGPRVQDVRKFGTARWFSYYQQNELRGLFGPELEITREWRLDISPRPTIGCAARRVSRQ
jgi:SAM-dependent methyltransferase